MRRTALVVVLAAFALGGCSLIIDNGPQVVNHCASSDDCSGGATCDPATSMCVHDATLPYPLWLEVVPPADPSGAAASPTDLGPYDSFAGSISLVVPRPVAVRGTVRRDGRAVSAQITFTPSAPTPLGTRTTTARASATGEFATFLPSRGSYDVLVEPLGDDRALVPPFRSPADAPLVVGATDASLAIVLPTGEPQIVGDLVDGSGAPLTGFEVLATDRASGVVVSSVATTAATDAVPGRFTLALATTTAPFDLVVRPTAMRQSAGLVPTYRIQPELLMPVDGRVSILIPSSLPAVHWAGTVEYPSTRGGRPVANAVVRVTSTNVVDATTGLVGSLDVSLMTDANGVYDGEVLPGTYTVTITPTADPELGVLHESRELRPAAGTTELIGHVFEMPLRTVLAGTVNAPDGDLVRDARVRARPLGLPIAGLTDPDVARLARSSEAMSDPMGAFRLELDVGVYDLVVEPPIGSHFAWAVELGYGVGGSSTGLADVMQVDAPVVVESDLTWIDGGELGNAEVRAFAITPDGRAVMVGRSTADAHGHARTLVPPMLVSRDPAMARVRP
jgi:hypothetical protein